MDSLLFVASDSAKPRAMGTSTADKEKGALEQATICAGHQAQGQMSSELVNEEDGRTDPAVRGY